MERFADILESQVKVTDNDCSRQWKRCGQWKTCAIGSLPDGLPDLALPKDLCIWEDGDAII